MKLVSGARWPVQAVDNRVHFVVAVDREVRAFRQVLAQQPVGVFAGTWLPGTMRIVSIPKNFISSLSQSRSDLSPHTVPVSQPVPQLHTSERTTWAHGRHLAQPFSATPFVSRECLVLPSGPAFELSIRILEDRMYRRSIERPIAVPAPLYRWIALLREVIKLGEVRRRMRQLRTVCRIRFRASLLAAGENLVNSRL
jgi:hypothetical protein